MRILKIRWQRLVDEKGSTCDRCGNTETAVEDAVKKLQNSLGGLGISVVLEKTQITMPEFAKDTIQSNKILIGEKTIEEWLSGTVGKSKCCSTCGESDCRTITINGKTYEAIPPELIVQAGLLAGASLLQPGTDSSCCPPKETPKKSTGCCPEPKKAGE